MDQSLRNGEEKEKKEVRAVVTWPGPLEEGKKGKKTNVVLSGNIKKIYSLLNIVLGSTWRKMSALNLYPSQTMGEEKEEGDALSIAACRKEWSANEKGGSRRNKNQPISSPRVMKEEGKKEDVGPSRFVDFLYSGGGKDRHGDSMGFSSKTNSGGEQKIRLIVVGGKKAVPRLTPYSGGRREKCARRRGVRSRSSLVPRTSLTPALSSSISEEKRKKGER